MLALQGRAGAGAGAGAGGPALPQRRAGAGRGPVHVCFCTDDMDMRGLVVAIKTAMEHASDPSRLRFHVVTSPDAAPLFSAALLVHLRGVPIDFHCDRELQSRIDGLIRFERHTWTTIREERLHSTFNFAPFFLPAFLEAEGCGEGGNLGGSGVEGIRAERLVYLDPDVVVLGDLAELDDLDLGGRAVGVVADCRWRHRDLFGSRWLRKRNIDRMACAAQRGVVVIDVEQWKSQRLTEQIVGWMSLSRNSSRGLWHAPAAPSAWLLALNGTYLPIDEAWSCSNLGREMMSLEEGWYLRHGGFDSKAFVDLGVVIDELRGNTTPFVATCTDHAKLLHFNGPLKPWRLDVWRKQQPAPVCAEPKTYTLPNPHWSKSALVYSRKVPFILCVDLWKMHISEELDCALRDIEGEWMEDERAWRNSHRVNQKKKDEDAQRAKEAEEAKKKADAKKATEAEEAQKTGAEDKQKGQ